jgi:hypothetical protein
VIFAAIRRALSSEIRDCGTERPAQRKRLEGDRACAMFSLSGWWLDRCQFDNLADAV